MTSCTRTENEIYSYGYAIYMERRYTTMSNGYAIYKKTKTMECYNEGAAIFGNKSWITN